MGSTRKLIDKVKTNLEQNQVEKAGIVSALGGDPRKLGLSTIGLKQKPESKLKLNPLGKKKVKPMGSGKPSLAKRVGKKIGSVASKVKSKISNSFIGKTYRAIKKVLKFAWNVVKKVGRAIKKTVKAIYKTVKFSAKAFVKTSKFVGKAVVGAASAIGRGVKSMVNSIKKVGVKKALTGAINNFAPGKFITKLGWKAIKFVGKKLWTGIKKLAFNAFQFFARLFGFMGKFVNKVGNWVKIIGSGLISKTYRFLVKPIATMMVTIFGFVTGVVMAPINFMKWLVSSVMDRVLSAMSSISSAAKKVLRSTMGIFKRILTNPLTLILLIGGIFFFFKDKLLGWLNGMIGGARTGIVKSLSGFASQAWDFLSGLWEGVKMVGGLIFKVVDWITNPKGIISKFIVGTIKMFFMIKSAIKQLMKATGKSNIDILCMFLAGDTIGLALHAIAGGLIVFWKWIRDTKFMRWIMGIINAFVVVGKLIFSMGTVVWRSLKNGMWEIMKGNFGGVVDAITAPWKSLWT